MSGEPNLQWNRRELVLENDYIKVTSKGIIIYDDIYMKYNSPESKGVFNTWIRKHKLEEIYEHLHYFSQYFDIKF